MEYILFAFLTSLILSYFTTPSLIRISKLKGVYDEPNCDRKKHFKAISRLGGISIFCSLLFAMTFWANQSLILELQYIICSLILVFLAGVKDDVIGIRAYKKLYVQVISALILCHFTEIKLTTFYGLFGINEIPMWFSYFLTVFVIVCITNSFNLIDGVDGLASSVGILSSMCFGTWFLLTKNFQFAILAFTLAGALIGFLFYNWTPAKIFMGDSGSLTLGFIVSILAIKFIEMNRIMERDETFKILSVPVITIAILIVPLFDTLRVFFVRVLEKRSPFSPDRNHLHHLLIDRGASVRRTVITLLGFNSFIILLSYFLKGKVSGEWLLAIIVSLAFTFSLLVKKVLNK